MQLNCHLASHRSHDHPPIWLALFWHSLSTFIYSFLQSFCTSSLLPLSPHLSQDHPQVTRSPLQMTSLSLTLLLYIPCRLMLAALRSRSRSSCMLRSRRTTRRNWRLPNRNSNSVPTSTSLDQHHREPRTQRDPLKVVKVNVVFSLPYAFHFQYKYICIDTWESRVLLCTSCHKAQ